MQRESRPQKKNSIDLEQIAAILLLFFLLFEILLIAVTLIRSVVPKDRSGGELESTQIGTEDPSNSNGEKDFIPVFSGGVLPPRPHSSAASSLLGDEILSEYAVLIDAESGEILASKNADVRFSPASMTKVMTLIVACENLTAEDLKRRVVYTQEIADYVRSGSYEGTSTSLPVESGGISCIGDEYVLGDLLYGIGVASAADCTYMIALEVAGSEEAFVVLMNQKAAEMGLKDTHFDNAVGFDSENNYTTADEMAMIMSYAMQSTRISDYLAVRPGDHAIRSYYLKDGAEASYPVTFKNSLNSRLEKYAMNLSTSKLVATKTGYTTESFMVLTAQGLSTGKRYVLVVGEKESGDISLTQKFKNTMIDIEKILNTYAK